MSHAATEAGFAAAIIDPQAPVPSWAHSPRGDVDAKRFAVYRNNVHVALLGALRAKFPVTARLVGEDFFKAMARLFVANHKPSSPLLAEYGSDFPVFIQHFEPARSVPYLADVARLECAWMEAYHAADANVLEPAALGTIEPDALLRLTLEAHPATRLCTSNHPVGSIWSANQTEVVAPITARGPEAVLITRPGSDVTLRVIPPADGTFCAALFAGRPIEDAAAEALATASAFDLGTALVGLLSAGAFTAITSKGSLG